jgi:AraC family transcriptional regulator, transcriptional activator of pobA
MVSIQPLNEVNYFNPRRVKKYLLVWCSNGGLTIQVDEKELVLNANELLTITSGQYHLFKEVENAGGYLLEFTLDFFCRTEKDIELIFQNGLFCHFDQNEIIPLPSPAAISSQLQEIEQELREQPFQYLTSVHARIELILVEINRAKITKGDEVWKPSALFLQFLEFVRNNFQYNYPLNEIATRLQTTELKLNELARLHAGKTAQQVIHGLIVSEAKRIIQYEDGLTKEVAFALGFSDQYYFSKFFKNHTSISPTDYRKTVKI